MSYPIIYVYMYMYVKMASTKKSQVLKYMYHFTRYNRLAGKSGVDNGPAISTHNSIFSLFQSWQHWRAVTVPSGRSQGSAHRWYCEGDRSPPRSDSSLPSYTTTHTMLFNSNVCDLCTYRTFLKIIPLYFSCRHGPNWGGGLFSNMHFTLNINPLWPVICAAVLQLDCTMARSFCIQSTIRGHHVNFTRKFGLHVLERSCQFNVRMQTIMIHLQLLCWRMTPSSVTYRGRYPEFVGFFLLKSGSEMTCQADGNRQRSAVEGKALVVPCVYIRLQKKAKALW